MVEASGETAIEGVIDASQLGRRGEAHGDMVGAGRASAAAWQRSTSRAARREGRVPARCHRHRILAVAAPTDFRPISQMQLARFDGQRFVWFDEPIDGG
jgi:hypothetical protein